MKMEILILSILLITPSLALTGCDTGENFGVEIRNQTMMCITDSGVGYIKNDIIVGNISFMDLYLRTLTDKANFVRHYFSTNQQWTIPPHTYSVAIYAIGGGGAALSGCSKSGTAGSYVELITSKLKPGDIINVVIGPSSSDKGYDSTVNSGTLSMVAGGGLASNCQQDCARPSSSTPSGLIIKSIDNQVSAPSNWGGPSGYGRGGLCIPGGQSGSAGLVVIDVYTR